jgi:hypothetical protein
MNKKGIITGKGAFQDIEPIKVNIQHEKQF